MRYINITNNSPNNPNSPDLVTLHAEYALSGIPGELNTIQISFTPFAHKTRGVIKTSTGLQNLPSDLLVAYTTIFQGGIHAQLAVEGVVHAGMVKRSEV